MVHIVEKQGRAWVRLDRYTHQALAEVYAEMPYGTPVSTSQFAKASRTITGWKLARIKLADSRINDGRPPENVFELTSFGMAWAKALPPLSSDKRTQPPLFPLADVLAELPQPFIDWLSEDPPIRKLEGGMMLETLGVLIPTLRGDGYIPSDALRLAFEELRQRRQAGRSYTPAATVDIELDSKIADFLVKTTILPGVPWNEAKLDGRQLRPFNMTDDGAGWVDLIEDGGARYYRCAYSMRALVSAFASGQRDGFALARLLPKQFQEWLALGLPDAMRPPKHTRVLAVIGLTRRKGKYDWRLTKQGEIVVPMIAAMLRAAELGETVPDDGDYEGDGVEIVSPDADPFEASGIFVQPADNPWDILGDMTGSPPDPVARARAEEDGFAILAMTPGADDTISALDHLIAVAAESQRRIVEAPVPSNADLAAAGARRRGDISATDADFDIL